MISDSDEIISDSDTSTITKKSAAHHNTDPHSNSISDPNSDPNSDHIRTISGPQVPLTDKLTTTQQNSVLKENPQISVSNFSNNVGPTCSVTPSTQKFGLIMSTILNNASSPTQTHHTLGTAISQTPTTPHPAPTHSDNHKLPFSCFHCPAF